MPCSCTSALRCCRPLSRPPQPSRTASTSRSLFSSPLVRSIASFLYCCMIVQPLQCAVDARHCLSCALHFQLSAELPVVAVQARSAGLSTTSHTQTTPPVRRCCRCAPFCSCEPDVMLFAACMIVSATTNITSPHASRCCRYWLLPCFDATTFCLPAWEAAERDMGLVSEVPINSKRSPSDWISAGAGSAG